MKAPILLFCLVLPFFAFPQSYKNHSLQKDGLAISFEKGVLRITPLSDQAIRVQYSDGRLPKEQQDFVFLNKTMKTQFKFAQTSKELSITTNAVKVTFNKLTSILSYSDKLGKVFLTEKASGRQLIASTVGAEDCYIATQQFKSPEDESLFGLGQFQDGHYNLRNIPRKLIQVNTQIAIPFLYSSKGYGILWNQYGLTEFNPADNVVSTVKEDRTSSEKQDVEVTTTSGTQKVSQRESVFKGKFTLKKDGEYAFMLDLGNMESRHLLLIDGKPLIDQSNPWLPPAASKLMKLKSGVHTVQIVCKSSNTPKLTWRLTSDETTFRSPNAKSLDYVVFYGKNADDVIANYRNLSGNVPMLPAWAYGFWQCRERYTSGKHLVETVQEFRKRNLPMDVIVQDWQYWGKYGWGVPKFDETNYPNPDQFIKQLHDLNARFSISVWENLDKNSTVSKPYLDKNLYIPNSPWIDIFNPEARKTHWDVLNQNLFSLGIDSWWMDATEPENDALVGKQTHFGLGEFYRLVYPFFVSKAVYEGQRKSNPDKRVVILTRSAFPGQQRFGTINWSGDIGWNWDTYKRQIVAGLNYSLTGMPYWTTDIGGFFRPGPTQYKDEKYQDILVRWFQWGTFNPVFRMHGYQSETEPWKYGDAVENNMRKMLQLRYRLMPYIYSEGWKVSSKGSTIMRPLVMDFKDDPNAVAQAYQYMFGKSFLVSPVTAPNVKEWDVYLPKSAGWFNFWTGAHQDGGKNIKVPAPQDEIPLFIKAGSIVPLGKTMQFANEKPADTLEVRVYTGESTHFDLYEDEGDNYNYEKGSRTVIPFQWDEAKQMLTIGDLEGTYPGYLKTRAFKVVFFNTSSNTTNTLSNPGKTITYTGKKVFISSNFRK